jgi:hypothetical protein
MAMMMINIKNDGRKKMEAIIDRNKNRIKRYSIL